MLNGQRGNDYICLLKKIYEKFWLRELGCESKVHIILKKAAIMRQLVEPAKDIVGVAELGRSSTSLEPIMD